MTGVIETSSPTPEPLSIRISSALMEIQSNDPNRPPRFVLWTVCTLFALLLIWSIIGKLDIVAVAEGKLVPQTYTKIVQPLEAGTVKEILVKEGDTVKAGQVLMRLDATLVNAEGRSVADELALRQLQIERIDAELSGKAFKPLSQYSEALVAQTNAQYIANRAAYEDVIDEAGANRAKSAADLSSAEETLRMLEKTAPNFDQTARAYEALAAKGLVPLMQAQEKRGEAIEKAQAVKAQESTIRSLAESIESAQQKLEQLRTGYRSKLETERAQAISQAQKLLQESIKQEYRGDRLELRAPQGGVVKDVATTTVGAVVQPGTVLVTIVPMNDVLLAEVRIKNEDSGFVERGQSARIKLATFPFQKYGMAEGEVVNVSAEASKADTSGVMSADGDNQLQTYKALVRLNADRMPLKWPRTALRPGMQVTAELRQGERSVMSFLLSPVAKVSLEAGRER